MAGMKDEITSRGVAGPVRVLTSELRRRLVAECHADDRAAMPDWQKAMAVTSPVIYAAATHPSILEPLKSILGEDVMLWGSHFVRRKPGQEHAWHNDIESSVNDGRTVSVWIGLRNISRDSALQVIACSHLSRRSIQEVRQTAGVRREDVTAETALRWAKDMNESCTLVVPEMTDGDALFFDGWVWHGSRNCGEGTREALLLQYATPDARIRIPDPNWLDWPFKYLQQPKPPCIMVSGSDRYGVNHVVPAPVSSDGRERFTLSSRIYPIDVPLAPDPERGWKPYAICKGGTPNLQHLTCHVSALSPDHTPHPPHQHREEEILVVLDGEAEITLPDQADRKMPTAVSLKAGEFVYYPAWFHHTITARGDRPVTYLMFKWFNPPDTAVEERLAYGKYIIAEHFNREPSERGYASRKIFKKATECLNVLQCHTTVMGPGKGYPAHTDAHDVAIVVLKGDVETLGERIRPHGVAYFPAGQLHDLHNPSEDESAEYIVFEFHGRYAPPTKPTTRSRWDMMRDPACWRRKFASWKRRLTG